MINSLTDQMQQSIEAALRVYVAEIAESAPFQPMQAMAAYHMGWEGKGAGPKAQGKRLRPLITTLSAAANGGGWEEVLPAAAAIEIIHNLSLIHDDIEDRSDKRRGRPTVWANWGIPQAINIGDTFFALANQVFLNLAAYHPLERVLNASQIFQRACLNLTRGQFLDIAYESRAEVTLEDYWLMIEGKTSALLSASAEIGALLAGAKPATQKAYRIFGRALGLAFQVQDDILGIWGDEALTGKSAASDLLDRKKSLPVLYGLQKKKAFYRRWQNGPIRAEEVRALAAMLEEEGAYAYAQNAVQTLTNQALNALDEAHPQGLAGESLRALAQKLIRRKN